MPECRRCFVIKSLELLNDRRVELREPDIGIEHRRQFEDRMADRQGVHVDEQDLVADEFEVFRMIIAVDHMIILRYRLDQTEQLRPGLFRQFVLHEPRPVEHGLAHIRQFALRHHGAVDDLEHLNVFVHTPVHLLRIRCQDLGERLRIEQFKYRSIAVPDAHNIVGDRRRHTQDHSQPRDFPLVLDLIERIGVVVDLDDIIPVDPVHRAVGALADHFAALDRDNAICFFHRHHLGEAGHLEDLVDLGVHPRDRQIFVFFAQPQDHPEAGA